MVVDIFARSDDVRVRRLVQFANDNGMEYNRVRAGGIEIFAHRIFSSTRQVVLMKSPSDTQELSSRLPTANDLFLFGNMNGACSLNSSTI